MSDALSPRIALFTGKGGCGKSTLVASVALRSAQQGRRPVIVELGHRATMRAIFGCAEIGHASVEVAPGVHATNITPREILEAYIAEHVPLHAIARRVARSRTLGRFFDAAPAVNELLTLIRIQALLDDPAGYDPILVDLDSTGHARMFLELPRAFDGLVTRGPIRTLLDRFVRLLADPSAARLHFVTRAKRLPVNETIELYAHTQASGAVAPGVVIVNAFPALALSEGRRSVLERLIQATAPEEPTGRDLRLLADLCREHDVARAELARLEQTGLPIICIPQVDGALDLETLRGFGQRMEGAS